MLVGISAPELAFLEQQATSVKLAGTRTADGALTFEGGSRTAQGRLVSAQYFDVLEAPIAVGRGLHAGDNEPGRAAVVVLGHHVWTTTFAARPDILGTTVRFRDVPVTVVGVAGAGVRESPLDAIPDLWMPLAAMPLLFPTEPFAQEFLANPAHCCVDVIGRLHPGHSRARAETELSLLDRQFRADEPGERLGMRVAGTQARYRPEAERILPVFALLFAGVSLVLLVACANVSNLQLARAAARRREMTVRMALGAGRWRVVRQLLTEGLVLSLLATTISLVVSSMVAQTIVVRIDPSLADVIDLSIDGRVLLFAAGLTMVACLVTSLAPAIRGTRRLVANRTEDPGSVRLRSAFLSGQIAISVVLLMAALLLTRGLVKAASQNVGFRLETLTALEIERPSAGDADEQAFHRDVMAAVRSTSGQAVAAAALVPLGEDSMHTDVRRAGEPDEANRSARFQPVSSNYFDVLGIPLRAGRSFSDGASDEVVLNETLARQLWPDGDAVGGRLAGPGGAPGRRVVGVAADAFLSGLGRVEPTIFEPTGSISYLLFDRRLENADRLRALVTAVDPRVSVSAHEVGENIGSSLEAARHGARAAGALGLLALAVVAVGIAGVFSFVVIERTREIGIRMALGASRRGVRVLLLRRTGGPVAMGLVAGLLLATLAGPVLRGYLYGLSPSDPVAYFAAIAVIVLTAWISTLVPMRRALLVDPAATLRHD
jgi:predicted permease